MNDVPEWAKKRALELCAAEYGPNDRRVIAGDPSAFARYIAQHEKPPVDPLLIEAREVLARRTEELVASGRARKSVLRDADDYRSGRWDEHVELQTALAGLRRGIELAGQK